MSHDLEEGLLPARASDNSSSPSSSTIISTSDSASSLATIPIEVRMENIDYFVNKGKKQIIHDVSLSFRPGKMACLMGPSGSGKTTCLNLILGNASGEVKNGRILVNGQPGPPPHFKSVAKLIPQEDVLFSAFTVRETLDYHAQLVLPQSIGKLERYARVDQVIQSLGLAVCSDTRIGNAESRGISGGQRKRVSIGLELLSNPCVLCVDEPTSGLDSSSAEDVIQLIKSLCTDNGKRTIVCTIHQPSFRIFSLFDQVCLLTKGRLAFSGAFKDVDPFFASLGHSVPERENPCDYYMRLLQDEKLADTIPNEFARKQQLAMQSSSPQETSQEFNSLEEFYSLPSYPTSTLHQIWVLFRRQSYDYVYDTSKFARLLAFKLAVSLLIGGVWFQKANPARQEYLQSLLGSLFMNALNGTLDCLVITILSFPTMRAIVIREYKNGTYSVFSLYVAMMLSLAMFSILFVVASTLPSFLMVGWELTTKRVGVLFATMFLSGMIGNALGVSVGAASKDLVEAQNMIIPLLAPLVLFSGYVVPRTQIPDWATPIYKLSFFQCTCFQVFLQ